MRGCAAAGVTGAATGATTGPDGAVRTAASASAVDMPPLELDLPIAPSTDEIGDDGGSCSGVGVAARVLISDVGDSGFTPPVLLRGRGGGSPDFGGVGGGFAPLGRTAASSRSTRSSSDVVGAADVAGSEPLALAAFGVGVASAFTAAIGPGVTRVAAGDRPLAPFGEVVAREVPAAGVAAGVVVAREVLAAGVAAGVVVGREVPAAGVAAGDVVGREVPAAGVAAGDVVARDAAAVEVAAGAVVARKAPDASDADEPPGDVVARDAAVVDDAAGDVVARDAPGVATGELVAREVPAAGVAGGDERVTTLGDDLRASLSFGVAARGAAAFAEDLRGSFALLVDVRDATTFADDVRALCVGFAPVAGVPAGGVPGADDSLTSFASAASWTTGVCCSSFHSASSIASSSSTGVPVGVCGLVGLVGFVIASAP
jgi:hypothetical protein